MSQQPQESDSHRSLRLAYESCTECHKYKSSGKVGEPGMYQQAAVHALHNAHAPYRGERIAAVLRCSNCDGMTPYIANHIAEIAPDVEEACIRPASKKR